MNTQAEGQKLIKEKLSGKKIALLGLGTENLALARFVSAQGIDCRLTICDMRSREQLGERYDELGRQAGVAWRLGAEFNQDLEQFDQLFRSPGWTLSCPGIKAALKKNKNIVLTSAMELFLEACPTRNTIGVTGTKGKGTTSSLIAAMLKAGGKTVWLGGNIGVAPFSFIGQIKPADWVVLELSSFQLEGLRVSPHIAVMTNFSREHLAPADPNNPNYHKTLKAYWQAKWNIARWQQPAGYLIANRRLARRIAKEDYAGVAVYFGRLAWPSRLLGRHNQENAAAAAVAADLAGVEEAASRQAVRDFAGLEHRLELVHEAGGVKYYDDSFATTPEATMTALKSFRQPLVLLAGGADKGADFKSLAKLVVRRQIKAVVLFAGQASPRLKAELAAAGYPAERLAEAGSMAAAVSEAAARAAAGEAVLLSTACASFGLFKNYKERGELFQQEARKRS